jgi:hypothetical protein
MRGTSLEMKAKELREKKLREQPTLTEEEFALLVKHHRETVAKMRRHGEIEHCKRGRKVWYLNPKHVDAFNRKFEVRTDQAA